MEVVIGLLVIGAILLALETVLPGLIAGSLGVMCLIAAVVVGYQDFGAKTGNVILLVVCLGTLVGISLWVRFFPQSRMARLFISQRVVGEIRAEKPELLAKTGIALTQLRPCGTALIEGRRVDVVTEGGLVARETPVKVIAIEGMRVVVRPINNETSS
ncbi:MAG TPA: NfeD family protein [Candidatus Paceibacterota bacterium]|nr:NfeD family protein [Verrucomicrobiota bacterium]HRY48418.1 NfeD family protein [Candidatus Paceibacterota bacterium]HRZ99243.1 NfeD family protein [Candidatus Paceibacterota bacterium]